MRLATEQVQQTIVRYGQRNLALANMLEIRGGQRLALARPPTLRTRKLMGKNFNRELLVFDENPHEAMIEESASFYRSMCRRRTVRDFSNRGIPREVIDNALRTAGTAPSGANMQPWHFVAVSDPGIKREIRLGAEVEEREFYARRASAEWLKALEPLGTDENKPFLETAPWLIAVFLKKFSVNESGNRLKNYYTAESVGIACGMLLAALHLSGVATLTHTPSPMRFLNRILGRPKDERPYMLIVAGYPEAGATVPAISKKPLRDIATYVE